MYKPLEGLSLVSVRHSYVDTVIPKELRDLEAVPGNAIGISGEDD